MRIGQRQRLESVEISRLLQAAAISNQQCFALLDGAHVIVFRDDDDDADAEKRNFYSHSFISMQGLKLTER